MKGSGKSRVYAFNALEARRKTSKKKNLLRPEQAMPDRITSGKPDGQTEIADCVPGREPTEIFRFPGSAPARRNAIAAANDMIK